MKIAVFASGSGTNFQKLMEDAELQSQICLLVCNRPGARVLERAKKLGVSAHCIDHLMFQTREAFEHQIIEILSEHQIELIVLAGFMRILSANFVARYTNRIINIHPSILPKHPGLNTHQRVLNDGDSFHGVSIHIVTNQLDAGPILAQEQFAVNATDTVATLEQKVHQLEYQLYPKTIKKYCQHYFNYNALQSIKI